MLEMIDTEARDRIAKIWTELREHAADYWGPDKTNGKRSEVVSLGQRVSTLEDTIKHREDTREQNCLGLATFTSYIKTKKVEETEMKLEKIKAATLMRVQWIQLIGIVLVAFIALLK